MAKARPRRLLVPEVIQTSAMDCGPAALKSLLDGFGSPVSYGRLREACQTDVDGTSIDTLEDIARQLGLDAEQVMVPIDHLLLPESCALPAFVVVRQPTGFTHFVVVWRAHRRFVQVMDPGTGRRWPSRERFLRDVYVHEAAVPADAWREHASSDEFVGPLRVRLARLGAGRAAGDRLLDGALANPGWRAIAGLDASARMLESIAKSGGLSRGHEAARVLGELVARLEAGESDEEVVPTSYWFARPDPRAEGGDEQVMIRGAVLVVAHGRRDAGASAGADSEERQGAAAPPAQPAPLSPELALALHEPPSRPLRELWAMLGRDGAFAPLSVTLALAVAATGTAFEAVLFRSLFDIGRHINITDKRLWGLFALLVFLTVLVLVEAPLASTVLRMGRRLEGRFRVAFLRKIPRLGDRYFQSRPVSDMADRSHAVHALRDLPNLGAQLLRAFFSLLFTTLGIAWLDAKSAPIAGAVAVVTVAIPLLLQRSLTERDLRVRSQAGALSRYYLDALLGLVPVRAHGAERAMRREHENLLVEWVHASRARDRVAIGTEALQSVLGLALSGWLFLSYFGRVGEPGAALLLLYWAVSLPAHGQSLALLIRQIPVYRNTALRLMEPLGALEEDLPPAPAVAAPPASEPTRAVGLRFEHLTIRAAGHTILDDVSADIPAGAHAAIVGPSGAGKSSLVGVLLGWHRATSGRILVDGRALDASRLDTLRAGTTWVDPQIQIWNRSLVDNLVYGTADAAASSVGDVVEEAELRNLLETLPDGLATVLGEGGGLVSGGEGQRVRLGRAALRADARLVILDEPFRGLDRERRRELLRRTRRWWKQATLLCVTHDVGETLDFERVLVVEGGRIVEEGAPRSLASRPGSRYASMLEAELDVRRRMWGSAAWRRLHLRAGVLEEVSAVEIRAESASP